MKRSMDQAIGGRMALWTMVSCLLASGAAQAQTYVDDDNCPGPGSGTLGDPYCSVQDAIDAAVDFDEIIVLPGTYFEAIDLLGKAINLHSSDGADVTIIDAVGAGRVVSCISGEGPDTILDGFTITGGDTNLGGAGMFNFMSSPTVTNCVFTGNQSTNAGGGMYNESASSPTVTNCVFSGNTAFSAGGMSNNSSSSPTVTDCVFIGNTADGGVGGGMASSASSSPTVTNCTFIGNSAPFATGGGMWNSGPADATVINCTFSGNTAGTEGGGLYSSNSAVTVTNCTFNGNAASDGGGLYNNSGTPPAATNCILWANTPNQISDNGSSPVVTYSDVQGGYAGTGNVDADPRFIDADGPDDVTGTADDDLRLDRFSSAADAGDNTAPDLAGITTDLDGDPRFFDDAGVTDTGNGTAPMVDMGAYERQEDSAPITILVFAGESVQDAVDSSLDDDEIVVGPGTYTETIDFLGKAITLRSSDGPAMTILDALGAGTVVTCANGEGPGTVLDGFTITGGSDPAGGGMDNDGSSPTVTDCIFRGNSTTGDGGGMRNNAASPTVTNCVFTGNTADLSGGGMSNANASSPTLTNCTFAGNTAGGPGAGGGMANDNSNPTVINCILWANTPDQISDNGSSPVVTYSDVQGGYAGTGNIDADPRFVDADGTDDIAGTADDDLRPDRFSAAADAGDNTAPGLSGITTDLDGNPRFFDDAGVADTGNGTAPIVDMGAYERQDESQLLTILVFAGESVQDAVDSSLDGDEIVVGPGTYTETIDFLGKAITLRSSNGPALTILDALGGGTVVTCASGEGPATVLDGFTITGGSDPAAGGMDNDGSSPTVTDCIFRGNSTTGDGGGMRNNAASPTVTNCVFTGNTADFSGGGMSNANSSSPMVTNCTFAGNTASGGPGAGGGMANDNSSPTVINCILWANTPDQVAAVGSSPVVTYSVVQGGYTGTGNVDADPLFVDADGPDDVAGTADDDLRPDRFSAAADAGDNTAPGLSGITTDLDGNPRLVDDAGVTDTGNGTTPIVDMGAYERQEDSGSITILVFAGESIQDAIDSVDDAITSADIIVGPGTYNEPIDFRGEPFTVRSSDGPAVTILDAQGAGTVVFCISGEGPDTVLEGFTITGGSATFGGGMHNLGSSPTVTNCVFLGNTADSEGGGMYNVLSSPTVIGCVFLGNTADMGGGMYNFNASSPAVTNCLFSGNSAVLEGGGMLNVPSSNPVVTNCTFSGNTAGTDGGGIANYNASNPTVTNCVLWNNTPDQIFDDASSPVVTYSDVQSGYTGTGNVDTDPRFIDADGPDDVAGTADDDLRLDRFSAAADAADNTTPGLIGITTDLDGNPRFDDDAGVIDSGNGTAPIVDMGAYERQDDSPLLILVPDDLSTIQAALTVAVNGAEIVVGPGTYNETIDFGGKAITLRSADGPAVTILDGLGAGTVVSCISGEGPDTILDGFTITGGEGTDGGGMHTDGSSPTVTDCIFSGNSATFGGGMCNLGGSNPTVSGCLFSANTATSGGGGMYNFQSSSPTVTDCTFTGNTSDTFAGGMANEALANATVTGCVFNGNVAASTRGGGLWSRNASPTVTNCTFSGNTAGTEGGGLYGDNASSLTVTNCTFSGNTAADGGGMANQFQSATLTVINCIVWDNTPDQIFTNNAPLPAVTYSDVQGGFAGTGNVDAHPRFIDADGPDDVVGTADDDLRLDRFSAAADAGDNTAPGLTGITTDLDGNPRFDDDAGVIDSGNGTAPIVDMGAYEHQDDSPLLIQVPDDLSTIQAALTVAVNGAEIVVGPGTYNETIDFGGKAITLRSADGPAVTIIDGLGAGTVVSCISGEGPGSVLDGFTITGGDGVFGGGMLNDNASSPTVLNCIFSGNTASEGAGMVNTASSSPAVTNCVFSGNTATGNGGGMVNAASSNPVLTNCTFSNNTAGIGGGGISNVASNPTVINSILWGNTPDQISDGLGSSSTVTYSDVQGGFAGTGNLDADPRFVPAPAGDVHLNRFSPCVDAGSNAAPTLVGITTDLEGDPRFVDDAGVTDTGNGTAPIVDMGAYERQDDSGPITVQVFAGESIQDAVDAFDVVTAGDEIVVGPGTYNETIDFGGRAIALRSADGPEVTIIDALGAGTVVTCTTGEGPGTVLDGFTITGGNAVNGGGMYNDGTNPTVTNCIFSGNSATHGGGMYNDTSSPTVTNCLFDGNTATDDGGGMFNFPSSSVVVTSCTFVGNAATRGGGIINFTGSNAIVTNCTFSGNTAGARGGGAYTHSSSPQFTNCTFSGNSAVIEGGGMIKFSSNSATVVNSVLWNNTPDQILLDAGASLTVTYCDVAGGYAGTGNVDVDPLFLDADGADDMVGTLDDDLRLYRFTPVADAGDNTAPGLVGITTDFDGNARFVDDGGVTDTGNGTAPIVDMGAYERQEDSGPTTIQVVAGESIQDAIDSSIDDDEIVVGPGTYPGTINFGGRPITLRSSDGPAVTILDGLGAGSVVICENGEGPDTVLEGFTITGGNGSVGGGMRNQSSSATVNNCIFDGNNATTNGGGMYNSNASPTVTNCVFRGNSAVEGGGMLNRVGSNPILIACVFSGNTANNGAGLFNTQSSPTTTNCTFSGNAASSNGGGMYSTLQSSPTLTNCILWDNTPDQIFDSNVSSVVAYSDVQGGFAGTGNIDADPMFVDADGPDDVAGTGDDDPRLDRFTPVADAGDNTAPGLVGITTDLDGNPRLADDAGVADTGNGTAPIVDMGAYERQEDSALITIQVVAGESIQDAIDAFDLVVDGDEIVVGPGTYNETIDFGGRAIILRSSDGPAVTIIDAMGAGSVVTCVSGEGPDTVLDGFTLTGGTGTLVGPDLFGGGSYNSGSSPTVTNCTFSGNSAASGGGMFNVSSNPTVTNCTFSGNSAGGGGAMFNIFSNPTLTNSTLSGNSAAFGGGMFNDNSNPAVTNCVFSGNTAISTGGGMENVNSNPTLTNSTLSGNSAATGGGMSNSFSDPTLTNCIVWGNTPDQIADAISSPVVTYSVVQGGYAGTGNVDADPRFVDVDGADDVVGTLDDDLRLDRFSAAADAGDNTAPALGGITTDLDGSPRFVDDAGVADTGNGTVPIVDMGAYERQDESALVTVQIVAGESIQDAIDALDGVLAGDEIVVGPGTYNEAIDFGGKAVTLRSSDGPAVTIIDAQGVGTVVTCASGEGPDTTLDGFTITGGDGSTGGGMHIDGSSPTVTGCVFTENTASAGAGMSCLSSSPAVLNCIFIANSASSFGGGMYNFSSSPTVTNCTFIDNSAQSEGGGMYNGSASDATVTNCTFLGNAVFVDQGGGMANANSSPTVTNCILWANTPDQIRDNPGSSPVVTYSDVQGGYAGTGNVDADPRFIDADGPDDVPGTLDDDLRPDRFSAAADAGDNTAPGLSGITMDLDGNARFVDDAGVADTGNGTAPIIDMGAYERQDESTPITVQVLAGESIQDAIDGFDFAVAGDEIVVGPGTYTETIDFGGKPITLRSSDGPDVTIIDGLGAGSVVTCSSGEGPDTVLEGFTITGGDALEGGGMHIDSSSPTVVDCVFSGNTAGLGGGMANANSSPTVTGCVFVGNTSDLVGGGGMINEDSSNPVLTNCTFNGNTAADGGGMYNAFSDPTLTNCSFSGNTAGLSGGGMYSDFSDPTLTNCTFSGNVASNSGGGMFSDASSPTVTNCILWNNAPDQIFASASAPVVTYSDVQGGYTGTGNVNTDPEFIDADGPDDVVGTLDDDLRLDSFSSVADAGDNTTPGLAGNTTDLDGNPRFVDDASVPDTGNGTAPIVDMGAYERQQDSPVAVINVPEDLTTIQVALTVAVNGTEIVVAPGTYTETIDFDGKAVTLRSSNGPEVTIIDALGAGSVVSCTSGEGPSTVLDGFTLTGGAGTLVGPDLLGGGMYNQGSSPTVSNCIFDGNSVTSDGGGMHNDNASPAVTYCLFTGNAAGSLGGGMSNANASSPAVNHCVFTGNTAGDFGGAMHNFNASDPAMTNCTFADNTAGSDGGGICNVLSDPTLSNAIVWGNAPGQILDLSSAPTVTYSDVQGGYPGVGNIDADPGFRASAAYRLNRFSPCADAGDNTTPGLSGITADLDGNARFVDDAGVADTGNGTAPLVDMGAYEQQEESTQTLFVFAGGSIQTEIDDAFASGDEIIVGPGTYTETIDFDGKAITLRSSDGPAVTIIDGLGAGTVVSCISGEGPDTILDGFTITGGDGVVGGGMLNDNASSPTVLNCIFSGNTASEGAGMVNTASSSPAVTNCVFSGNTATATGGGMVNAASSNPVLTNCTFSGNTAGIEGGAIANAGASPTVINCILWSNTPDQISDGFGSSSAVSYSNVQGGFAGTGNLDADPRFVPAPAGDVHLNRFSPCVDAGTNNTVGLVAITTDLDGDPRFVDDTGVTDTGIGAGPLVDMGAYERQDESTNTVFVFAGGSIQNEILGALAAGDEIIVGPGTYTETIDFLGKAVTLRSSDGPAVTILDGQGAGTVVSCTSGEGPDTVLDGFTITGGDALIGGGMRNDDSSPTVSNCIFSGNVADLGGGMRNDDSSPTVSNCTFSGNVAGLGGGMYNLNSSSPAVSNCTFSGNAAEGGGGMYNLDSSSPAVTNCIFSGNSVNFSGGGMVNVAASPMVINCTFSSNTAANDGGGIYNAVSSNPTVTNCVLWDNTPDQIFNDMSSLATVTSSDVEGGYAGTGNIDADPLFADADGADHVVGTDDDDLRLRRGSPCVESGDDAAVPGTITTDVAGLPRFLDGDLDAVATVDMGAHELDVFADLPVLNVTTQILHATIEEGVDQALAGDVLAVLASQFGAEPDVGFQGKAITIQSVGELSQPAGGTYTLADATRFETLGGDDMLLDGELILPSGRADVAAGQLGVGGSGAVIAQTGASLFVDAAGGAVLSGETFLFTQATMSFSNDLTMSGPSTLLSGANLVVGAAFTNAGELTASSASFVADNLTTDPGGSFIGYGEVFADVINDGSMTYIGDTVVTGDYTNNDTTIVQIGTLTIVGSLTNNGTIFGDISLPPESAGGQSASPGDGLAVLGDYAVGAAASHLMPDPIWLLSVNGGFDVAIDDNTRYDMAQAELWMTGTGGVFQPLEIMSVDIGADAAGLDRTLSGHYPIGTLRIGPAPTTVDMVDNHDNDGLGQALCEAIYVETLLIEAGATLNTNGCPVYYTSLILDGTVDDPANLILLPQACPWDCGVVDGEVGINDFLEVLAQWGTAGSCDFDGDGVGINDFLDLLANWGPCP